MSFELLNTLATCGTFVVIAATAGAAIVQLRHARGGNQIAALAELRTSFQSPEFADAFGHVIRTVPDLLKEPEFRYQLVHRSARAEYKELIRQVNFVANYFEDMGALMVAGLLDKTATNMIYSSDILIAWEALSPLVAVMRRANGPAMLENFEYAAMLAKKWIASHPLGDYPRNAARLEVPDTYRDDDLAYVQVRRAGTNGADLSSGRISV